MRKKTAALTDAALDWAVSQCVGIVWEQGDLDAGHYGPGFKPSTRWGDGGPIIERECITCIPYGAASTAPRNPEYWEAVMFERDESVTQYGPTPLIAAMRCYVASKLGDEVEVPEELQPRCPHCARMLEDVDEVGSGLCTSDDCPRHDNPEAPDEHP